jgi:hypothetical protein
MKNSTLLASAEKDQKKFNTVHLIDPARLNTLDT